MRQEVLVGQALVVGGGTAAAVALSDGSEGTRKSTASTAAPGHRHANTQTMATTTAADRPPISRLRVRVRGRLVLVETTRIGFRYCHRHVRTCAAIRPA